MAGASRRKRRVSGEQDLSECGSVRCVWADILPLKAVPATAHGSGWSCRWLEQWKQSARQNVRTLYQRQAFKRKRNMRLIVGLGNPGAEYVGTRHNAGFEVVELLARRHSIAVSKRNFKAVYGEGAIGGERVLLAR